MSSDDVVLWMPASFFLFFFFSSKIIVRNSKPDTLLQKQTAAYCLKHQPLDTKQSTAQNHGQFLQPKSLVIQALSKSVAVHQEGMKALSLQ